MMMSLEIPTYPTSTTPPASVDDGIIEDDATMVTHQMPVNAKPMNVLISPIVPVPATDGATAAASTSLPVATYTGVLFLDHHKCTAVGKEKDDTKMKREKWLQEMRGWLMMLATLAASVTYQAGLNPPGGFWQADDNDGHVAGSPVLESKFATRYNVFFYFNATAFVTSVVIIILLMNESFYHSEVKVEALEIIVVLDMVALMGAYIAGSTREVSSSIYIIVLAAFVFLYVIYTARFLPKLWGVVLKVSCVRDAAEKGMVSMPQQFVQTASPLSERTDDIVKARSVP